MFTRECYWTVTDSQRFSPTVQSMLKIKEIVTVFLKCSIGNGKTAKFWHDFWTDIGPLLPAFGESGTRELRLRREANVCDAVVNGNWSLPAARSDVAETLHIVLTTMNPPSDANGDDVFLWRNGEDHFVPKFSVRPTWQRLRQPSPLVPWSNLVWFKEEIPRCSFVTWMAVLARLPTKDRLVS